MSKNNQKGKNNTKESFIDPKLKESNIKYNNAKDIEVISRNYLKNPNNNARTVDQSKKMSNKIPKLLLANKKDEKEIKEDKDIKELTKALDHQINESKYKVIITDLLSGK